MFMLFISLVFLIYLLFIVVTFFVFFFVFKQKPAYDRRISDWSSDVCSSDLDGTVVEAGGDQTDPAYRAQPGDLSSLMYTSGTAGRAKGVMHTHGNDAAIAMNCVMEYSLTPADKALHIAPLYHVGGLQAYFLPHVMVGGTNIVEARYAAFDTLRRIQSERVTTLFARSEEHTSELQSLMRISYAVFCLKKKKNNIR